MLFIHIDVWYTFAAVMTLKNALDLIVRKLLFFSSIFLVAIQGLLPEVNCACAIVVIGMIGFPHRFIGGAILLRS